MAFFYFEHFVEAKALRKCLNFSDLYVLINRSIEMGIENKSK